MRVWEEEEGEGAGKAVSGGQGGTSPAWSRGVSVYLRECHGGHRLSRAGSRGQLAGTSPSSPWRWHLPISEGSKSKDWGCCQAGTSHSGPSLTLKVRSENKEEKNIPEQLSIEHQQVIFFHLLFNSFFTMVILFLV